MSYKKPFCVLFLSLALIGCSINPSRGCKPVLMPYVEYGYKAYPIKLSNNYIQKTEKIIDFHGLKVAVPLGWKYKKVFAGKTIKFWKDNNRSFILSFKKNIDILYDAKTFYMIGCKNFNLKDIEKIRTKKGFYTDLYTFTDEQIDSDPTFWQYYILWSKTEFLRDTDQLMHYKGDNLEAFQRNSKHRPACAKAGVVMQSEIFPRKIDPDYLAVTTGFKDDAFFVEFIEMLNAMNPMD